MAADAKTGDNSELCAGAAPGRLTGASRCIRCTVEIDGQTDRRMERCDTGARRSTDLSNTRSISFDERIITELHMPGSELAARKQSNPHCPTTRKRCCSERIVKLF